LKGADKSNWRSRWSW